MKNFNYNFQLKNCVNVYIDNPETIKQSLALTDSNTYIENILKLAYLDFETLTGSPVNTDLINIEYISSDLILAINSAKVNRR